MDRIHESARIEYDDLRKLVWLKLGHYVLDGMTIHEFEQTFGLMAAVDLTRR